MSFVKPLFHDKEFPKNRAENEKERYNYLPIPTKAITLCISADSSLFSPSFNRVSSLGPPGFEPGSAGYFML